MGWLVFALASGVVVYAFVDCWRSGPREVQRLTRPAWLVLILVLPLVGAIGYLTLGRVAAVGHSPHRTRVVAPDDDPEFLRNLDFQQRQAAARERRRREAEEKRRRKKAGPDGGRDEREDRPDGDSGQPAG